MQSAKERESKKVNEEILQLLTQPTAKVTNASHTTYDKGNERFSHNLRQS